MVHGRTDTVYRPRPGATLVSAVAATLLLVAYVVTRLDDFAIFSAPALLLLLRSGQRIEVEGGLVRRSGLRRVDLEIDSASVVQQGRSPLVELCFLGRSLELRDAQGSRLHLESWLWTRATRDAICAALPERAPAAWAPPAFT